MARKSSYAYSKYQYRVEFILPNRMPRLYASYVHRENAERKAKTLAKSMAVVTTVTRRCDQRVVWESTRNR